MTADEVRMQTMAGINMVGGTNNESEKKVLS